MNKTMPQRHKERLAAAIKRTVVDLDDHIKELELIEKIEVAPEQNEFVEAILKDAIEDAKSTLENGFKLVEAYSRMK